MGWSDARIENTITLITLLLWFALLAAGVFRLPPVNTPYMIAVAALLLFRLWRSFRRKRA